MDPSRDAAGTDPRAAWRRAAARELAAPGAPPDEASVDALAVPSPEGGAILPIYPDRAGHDGAAPSVPGAFPFVRGARPAGTGWIVGVRHHGVDPARTALDVADDLGRGVDGVVVGVDRAGRLGLDPASEPAREAVGDGGVAVVTAIDLAAVLAPIDWARHLVWIDAGANAVPFAVAALERAAASGVRPEAIRLFAGLDITGALARDGALPRAVSALASEAAELVEAWRTRGLGGRPLAIGAGLVHEAGGTASHEIGFALAALAELLRALEARGVAPERSAAAIAVEIAVGADLFGAIAKVRALRLAWSRLLVASGVAAPAVPPPFVAARTAARSLSRLDPWTNAVRATTEAFAAAAAGVDLLVVRPWDEALGAPDRGARRLARNTQLVLRDEARLGDVADPGGGSGWIEAATESLARAAWDELRRIEGEGGLLASLESGAFAGRVKEAATTRGRDVARRKVVLVGVNDFGNPAEETPARAPARDQAAVDAAARRALGARRPPPTVPDGTRLEVAASAAGRGATIALVSQVLAVFGPDAPPACDPIAPRRDAVRFEGVRARIAALGDPAGDPPRALLLPVGSASSSRARVAFSQRLLEVGGLAVITGAPCTTADEAGVAAAVAAVAASGASVVCLAGADDAYASLAEPLARAVTASAARPPVVLQAGRPAAGREAALRESGISGWFFAGGDVADVLEELAARLELREGGAGPRPTASTRPAASGGDEVTR